VFYSSHHGTSTWYTRHCYQDVTQSRPLLWITINLKMLHTPSRKSTRNVRLSGIRSWLITKAQC
jgi:hypothetical protein